MQAPNEPKIIAFSLFALDVLPLYNLAYAIGVCGNAVVARKHLIIQRAPKESSRFAVMTTLTLIFRVLLYMTAATDCRQPLFVFNAFSLDIILF